jgi:hypothetical protein
MTPRQPDNGAGLSLYRVIRELQLLLAIWTGACPTCHPTCRTPHQPDQALVVVREGRAGLIEVDGPHHRGRLAADGTRDRHWRNSGFVHIERILVEETAKDSELDALVRTFLKRLRTH